MANVCFSTTRGKGVHVTLDPADLKVGVDHERDLSSGQGLRMLLEVALDDLSILLLSLGPTSHLLWHFLPT